MTLIDSSRLVGPLLVAWVVAAIAVIYLVSRILHPRGAIVREQTVFRLIGRLHADPRGGVQSLAFVMTFPVLLLLVLFIVQLSQLLIAVVTVQYAAFAAARSASVWIPAVVRGSEAESGRPGSGANVLPIAIQPGIEVEINPQNVDVIRNRKTREIWSAAALACVSISPSRPVASSTTPLEASPTAGSLAVVLRAIDPNAAANGRLPVRIASKVNYSFANTSVGLRYSDRSNGADAAGQIHTYNPLGHPEIAWDANEVGWQDMVTATVRHRFALLPGPGRWLAAGLTTGDGRISRSGDVYQTTVTGIASMSIEGLESLRPRTHAP